MNAEMQKLVEAEALKIARKQAHFAATGRDLHTDIPLSNVALGYRPVMGVADKVMPIITVPNQSGFVTEFFRKDQLRLERSRRAPGTEANRVDRNVGSKQFFCQNYALKYGVTAEDLANADPIKKAELFEGAAKFLTDKLWLGWEQRVVTLANTTGVGSYSVVASRWNSAGDPIKAISAARDNVRGLTGLLPNRILFGYKSWESFRQNSNVRNLIYGTNNGGGFATIEAAKDLLEVDELLVSRAVYNSGNEAQAESVTDIMGDSVLLYYVPSVATKDSPSWGYTYRWAVAGIPSLVAERLPYDAKRKVHEIEVSYYQDERVTGSEYGFLIQSVNSNGAGAFGT